jgi:PKD repeat protein
MSTRNRRAAWIGLILGVAAGLASCDWLGSNVPPVAGFTCTPDGGYAPLSVTFDAGTSFDPDGSIRNFSWDLGDGTTVSGEQCQHGYEDNGTFTVTLTVKDNRGERSSTSKALDILNPPPVPSATASAHSGTSPLTIEFDAGGSTDASGNIISYDWDFGDGSTAAGVTATHTYTVTAAQNFVVQLTVTDDDGAASTTSVTVHVAVTPVANEAPVARFTADPTYGTVPVDVAFDGAGSTDADGSIASYEWDFGDGTSGNGQAVVHTYSLPGDYNVRLTVADNDGSRSSAEISIEVEAIVPTPPPPPG